MARFTIPRDIYFGEGAMEALQKLDGKRALLVTGGSSMQRLGFLEQATAYLKKAGMETALFDGVEPDPSVETVLRGAKRMLDFRPDWIVAIGGGSAIDAAKAMWAFYEYPDTDFMELTIPFRFPTLRKKARFAAIPSTSGTASEVTAFSVITDYQSGVKYPLADCNITPDVAIVDPALACAMPAHLAALTGLDALTHAVEAYVSTLHNDFTDPLAMQAIATVFACLEASVGGDRTARAAMHNAQCLAGMAFSNALLGITHSMAHKTGAAFSGGHIVHGAANAIYLPKVIAFNAKEPAAKARYAKIAARLGIAASDDDDAVAALIARIRALSESLSVPHSIRAYEGGFVTEDEFLEKVDAISALAVSDACTGSNPRPIDPQQMRELLLACYYDADVHI